MKVRLNITIDEAVLQKAKKYASRHEASVSALIESYLAKIAGSEDIPLHIRALGSLKDDRLKSRSMKTDEYLESRRAKYGF